MQEIFREEGVNGCIVATIASRGRAHGHSKALEIVFVMFKRSQQHVKKVGVRGEKILSIASEPSDTDLQRNMLPTSRIKQPRQSQLTYGATLF